MKAADRKNCCFYVLDINTAMNTLYVLDMNITMNTLYVLDINITMNTLFVSARTCALPALSHLIQCVRSI